MISFPTSFATVWPIKVTPMLQNTSSAKKVFCLCSTEQRPSPGAIMDDVSLLKLAKPLSLAKRFTKAKSKTTILPTKIQASASFSLEILS